MNKMKKIYSCKVHLNKITFSILLCINLTAILHAMEQQELTIDYLERELLSEVKDLYAQIISQLPEKDGFDPALFFSDDFNLATVALRCDSPSLVMKIIEKGALPHKGPSGTVFMETLVNYRRKSNNKSVYNEILKLLVEKGLDANSKFDCNGFYPYKKPLLHYATPNYYDDSVPCDLSLVETLLQHGANPKKKYFVMIAFRGRMMTGTVGGEMIFSSAWKDAKKMKHEHPEVLAIMKKYRDKEKVAATTTEDEPNEKNIQL